MNKQNLSFLAAGVIVGALLHMRFGEPRSEIKEVIVEKEVEKKSSSTNAVATRKIKKSTKPDGASEETLEETFAMSDNSSSDVSKEKDVQSTTKFNSNGLFIGGGTNTALRPLGTVILIADPVAGSITTNGVDDHTVTLTYKLLEW